MNPFEPDPSGDVTRLPAAESGGGATGDVAFTETDGALSVASEQSITLATPTVNIDGAAFSGPDAKDILGGVPVGFQALALRDDSPNGSSLIFSAVLDSEEWNEEAGFSATSESHTGVHKTSSSFYAYNATNDVAWGFLADAITPASSFFNCTSAGTPLLNFKPFAAESATAYIFGTSLQHTSGKIAEVKNASATVFAIGAAPTAGQTGLYLYDADNDTLQQVTLGAADSGGLGFRCLRIPNAP